MTWQSSILCIFFYIFRRLSNGLTDIRNKLTGFDVRSMRNNTSINGITDEPGETREDCEMKVQHLLTEELGMKNVVIEYTHRIKAQSKEKKKTRNSDQSQ